MKKKIIGLFAFISLIFPLYKASAHNEIEETEKHLFINGGYVDFNSSKVKKYGYFNTIKYGFFLGKNHNITFDKKTIYINTKLPKDLKVNKYSLVYQYIDKPYRLIFNFLYIDDNLVEEADNIKTIGVGLGYKHFEWKGYITKFKNFDTYQLDLKYYLLKKNFKALIFIKNIHISKKTGISQKSQKNYTTVGFFSHYFINDYHIGTNLILGKRLFTVLENGMNLEHHPLEFNYSFILKIGKKLKIGTLHIGYANSQAEELPFNNNEIKINKYFIDYSFKF